MGPPYKVELIHLGSNFSGSSNSPQGVKLNLEQRRIKRIFPVKITSFTITTLDTYPGKVTWWKTEVSGGKKNWSVSEIPAPTREEGVNTEITPISRILDTKKRLPCSAAHAVRWKLITLGAELLCVSRPERGLHTLLQPTFTSSVELLLFQSQSFPKTTLLRCNSYTVKSNVYNSVLFFFSIFTELCNHHHSHFFNTHRQSTSV